MADTGKIQVYYGDGKGKTTAAMGQIVRAAGRGFKVLVFQFLKNNTSGERNILEKIPNVTCLPGCDNVKFSSRMNEDEMAEVKHYNSEVLDEIEKSCRSYDVLLMDEALCAVALDLLSEDRLLNFLQHKPEKLEVILTGHKVSDRMLEAADYVTEMKKRKHPYDTGIPARKGIEF